MSAPPQGPSRQLEGGLAWTATRPLAHTEVQPGSCIDTTQARVRCRREHTKRLEGGIGTMTACRLQPLMTGSVLHAAKEAARAGTKNGRCRDKRGERGGTWQRAATPLHSLGLAKERTRSRRCCRRRRRGRRRRRRRCRRRCRRRRRRWQLPSSVHGQQFR